MLASFGAVIGLRFDGRVVLVVADQDQPLVARRDAINPILQTSAVILSQSVYLLRPTKTLMACVLGVVTIGRCAPETFFT